MAYLLFTDEAPLREPVRGVSTFTKSFSARVPRDRRGRSLRDFDLHHRLFRHPLSYMIYSEAFDALPMALLERIYTRVYDVLTGRSGSELCAALPAAERQAILEIVSDTKSNLPGWWRNAAEP